MVQASRRRRLNGSTSGTASAPARSTNFCARGAAIAQSRLRSGSPPQSRRCIGLTSLSPNLLMDCEDTTSSMRTPTNVGTTRNEFARKPFGQSSIVLWRPGSCRYEKFRYAVSAGGSAARNSPCCSDFQSFGRPRLTTTGRARASCLRLLGPGPGCLPPRRNLVAAHHLRFDRCWNSGAAQRGSRGRPRVVELLRSRPAGLPGGFGWVIVMVIIAGHIAGRRGRGLRRAPWSATAGVAVGTIITLGGLLLLRVIAMQPRVVVPLGGMIVSGAMLAAGLTLRRLREDAEQARPAIEARLCLGLSARYQTLPSRKAARMDGLPVHI